MSVLVDTLTITVPAGGEAAVAVEFDNPGDEVWLTINGVETDHRTVTSGQNTITLEETITTAGSYVINAYTSTVARTGVTGAVQRSNYLANSSTQVSNVPAGIGTVDLLWSEDASVPVNDHLLDLSSPSSPAVLATGLYAITLVVGAESAADGQFGGFIYTGGEGAGLLTPNDNTPSFGGPMYATGTALEIATAVGADTHFDGVHTANYYTTTWITPLQVGDLLHVTCGQSGGSTNVYAMLNALVVLIEPLTHT